MLRVKIISFCFIITALISSCSSNPGIKFTPVDPGFMLESGKSIAVISGRNEDNDIELAEIVIEKLSDTGKFKVIRQSELKKMIPKYPLNVNFIDFHLYADTELTPYLSTSSKSAIDAVHKLVKTDYILVVWIDRISSINTRSIGTPTGMFVATRLISYPEAKVSGYSGNWDDAGSWSGVLRKSTNKIVNDIKKNTKK